MNERIVYADNAATTRMSKAAMDIMLKYLSNEYGNASQPYSFSRPAKKALREARQIIADCIGAKPDEIFFTSGGTESNNWVIQNAIERNLDIITTEIEHHAILNPCKYAENQKRAVSYLPVNDKGEIDTSSFCQHTFGNHLLSVMMANNEIGTVQDMAGLRKMAREALFHTDAVQAIGHIDINVKNLGVDMLSASAHKFNGPKGIGFLYVREGIKINPFIKGGSQEFGMRAGTENIASIMAMAVALRDNVENLDENQKHIRSLESILLDKLTFLGIDYVRNGINQLPGLISLSFNGFSGESILHRLDLSGICISTGSACDSRNTKISHVLKACKIPSEYATGTIRISLGKYNTIDDIQYIVDKLSHIVKQ